MKNQNKYSQLVEAQSPEPQTAANEDNSAEPPEAAVVVDLRPPEELCRAAEAKGASEKSQGVGETQLPSKQVKVESSGSSDEQSAQSSPTTASYRGEKRRQLQTSQLSLRGEPINQRRVSQVSGASSSQMFACVVSTTDSCGLDGSTNASLNEKHQQPATNLNRTISQSMLELDQSQRLAEFEVMWNNLSFSYGAKWSRLIGGRLRGDRAAVANPLVLNNLSGKFKSNQLVAIIGPSGCGKTTLLQFLAGNNPVLKNRLRITGLDEPKVAFIGQDDCLLPGLTARETLIYASRLQNSRPDFDHQSHILPILDGLGLTECADRSVTKLSGGQAKRVTIAQEMLYPTNLLILDEVTSGLDASTSHSIVKLLKRLVSDRAYPMSIVMSIHQPSARLFAIFDRVYVMSEGYCLYEGTCNTGTVNAYLARFGLECPKFHNIADYLIEVASEDLGAELNQQLARQQMINYQQKQVRQEFGGEHDANVVRDNDSIMMRTKKKIPLDINHDEDEQISEEQVKLNGGDGYALNGLNRNNSTQSGSQMNSSLYEAVERARYGRKRPLYDQFLTHFSRSLLRIRRSYILTYLQLVTYILLGLQLSTFYGSNIGTLSGCPELPMSFIAFIFSNETNDNDASEMRRIQENMNFLLVAIMTATFAALEITVITFPMEAKTVKREWRNGWYRVSSYFMGRTLADLPFQLVFVIVFCIVIYILTGQIGLLTWRFGSFVTIIVMTALIAQTVGFMFGAIFMDNLPAAVFTAPLCIFPALLFSGFFSRASQIPSFYRPMTFLSHFRYAFDALLVTLYGYDRCNCDQTVLTTYHDSLKNQTLTIKDMFKSLFGAVDCASGNNPEENSIEDTGMQSSDPLNMILNQTTTRSFNTSTSSSLPNMMLLQTIKPVEDALVDRVFEHMSNSSEPADFKGDAMDRLTQKFSHRITTMLNRQANFGHEVPTQCQEFNSYLMTEFDLHNDDLMIGLLMLLVFVIITRLVCNYILGFTISRRTR